MSLALKRWVEDGGAIWIAGPADWHILAGLRADATRLLARQPNATKPKKVPFASATGLRNRLASVNSWLSRAV